MGFDRKNAPDCERCKAQANCFYALLDKKAKKEWNGLRVAAEFKADDIVFFEGEKPTGMYVLCRGRSKTYKSTRTGQQLITRMMVPGDLIGYRSALAETNYTGTAMAMEGSTISMIDLERFNKFLYEHPAAARAVIRKLAGELGESQDKARDIAYKPAKARLSDVLLRVMRGTGTPTPTVTGVKRKELAEMAGLTIETTVRLLQSFERQGLVRRAEKEIAVLDPGRLQKIAVSPN